MTDDDNWATVNAAGTCCLCGDDWTAFGHNPYPFSVTDTAYSDDAPRCCTACNDSLVLPIRLSLLSLNIPRTDWRAYLLQNHNNKSNA